MTQGKLCTCGQAVQNQVDNGTHFYWCVSCGKAGKGVTADAAWKAFGESSERVTGRGNFERVAMLARTAMERKAAPFVSSDRPALDRLIKKNVEYVSSLCGKGYDDVWATEEGRESMMKALEESIELGATLPEMGSIVPYGGTAELIPDVEAFRFALTTGASSPFEWVNIEAVYGNDVVRIERHSGEFALIFANIPLDRGDLAGIAVYGKRRGGATEGEFMPIKMLDAMARKFSKPYQKSMRDIDEFRAAKAEGKTKVDSYDREYLEKVIKGKPGKEDWTKKIYLDEIDCPYTGPTATKMYAKLAGKSFLGPYMKTRNSAAAIHEMQETPAQSEAMVGMLINRTTEAMTPDAPTETAALPAESVAEKVTEKAPVISATSTEGKRQKVTTAVTTAKDDGLF